jgi:iron complex transport system permease protein
VCPHIVRLFIGSDNRYLIPASLAFGVALLLFADLVGRTIIVPSVLPVGIVTAFIGGPLFLYLIVKQKKSAW